MNYRLEDFVPFSADVYFRLLERMGETFWPLQLLTLVLGGAALLLALKNRVWAASFVLAPLWGFVALAFFMQGYAQLNWAGGYIGYAFLAQAALLVFMPLVSHVVRETPHRKSLPVAVGVGIALFGLVGQPLVAPLSGGSWFQAEVLGIHPDPTAITTLGVTLVALRGIGMWMLATLPVLWLLLSGLTLLVLDVTRALPVFAALGLGMLALLGKSVIVGRN